MFDRLGAALSSAARPLAAIAIGGCALLFVIPLATRCLTMADEGYLLLQALDLANGKVLYRDMDAFVTPGIWFLLALVFKLTEPSVIASRIPVVIAYLALIALSYRIPARIGGVYAGLSCVAIMMMCTVWAFPAWTFAFYSPFSVLFALAALERLLAFRAGSRRQDLILAGLLLGLSILFKQNYGVFALVGTFFSLVVLWLEKGQSKVASLRAAAVDSCWLGMGVVAIALPTLAYLGVHSALGDAFQSLIVHPLEFGGKHSIPYLDLAALFAPDLMQESVDMMTYGAQPIYRTPLLGGIIGSIRLVERLHVLLYWFPPLIFIMGCTLALTGPGISREEGNSSTLDGGLLSVILVCLCLFLGVFPRADFNHLINVYQPVVIAGVASFAVLFGRRSEGSALAHKMVGAALVVVFGVYFSVSAYWYYALVRTLNFEVEGSRGGVKVAPPEALSLRVVLRNLEEFSDPEDTLLTIPDIAMLNFLSKRSMPSAYYNLYEHHISHDGGAAVAAGAEENGATVVITRLNNFFSDRVGLRDYAPVLTEYIDRNFQQRYTIGRSEYLIYTRREEPIPSESFVSVLENCEQQSEKATIEKHLLFHTLYQTMGAGIDGSEDSLVTRCRVEIPASGGEFVWQIEYPRPVKLRSSTTLAVEVLVESDQQQRHVFSRIYNVKTMNPRVRRVPAPHEHRVDLSDYAGRTIDLIMRSTRSGLVVMSVHARRSFGTHWQHPRIVARSH
jgi:4-amino-4-deoxy-L-arabinose transferase-like glycosyltransferase